MKKVFLTAIVVLMMMGLACTKLKVNIPAEAPTWSLIYNWTLPENKDSEVGECVDKTLCKEKMWNPLITGIHGSIPLAAKMAGFQFDGLTVVPRYGTSDMEKIPYIMLMYTKEGIKNNTVSFIIDTGEVMGRVDVRKKPLEDWISFYTRGFGGLVKLLPPDEDAEVPAAEIPERPDTADAGTDTNKEDTADAGTTQTETAPERDDRLDAAELIKRLNNLSTATAITEAEMEVAAVACVAKINEFRATLSLPPLERAKGQESCANRQAKKDSEVNIGHKNFHMCESSAQNTCPGGYESLDDANTTCIKMMFDEGAPPKGECVGKCLLKEHGHYVNMTNEAYKSVACGFFRRPDGSIWANHNFYDIGGAPSEQAKTFGTMEDLKKAVKTASLAQLKEITKKIFIPDWHPTIDNYNKRQVIDTLSSAISQHIESGQEDAVDMVIRFLNGEAPTASDKEVFDSRK